MNIRCHFEPEDFDGSGQRLICNSAPLDCEDAGFITTVSYQVGYRYDEAGMGRRICLISMADGLVALEWDSMEDLCRYLNTDRQGYRPLSEREYLMIVKLEGNRFRK